MFLNHADNKAINDNLQQFLYNVAGKLSEVNFWDKLNEFSNDANQSASSEATALLAAPPTFKQLSGGPDFMKTTFLLGGVQNFNPNEGKIFVPIKEIGSAKKRIVPGPTQYSLSISRLFTSHSNLKRALYQWLFSSDIMGSGTSIQMRRAPGANGSTYFSGLESELYKIPFGIVAINCTASGDYIGSDMLERCYIQSVGSGKAAQTPVVVDQMQVFVSRIIPLTGSTSFDDIAKNSYQPKVEAYTPVKTTSA